jgi:hypothetical protein
MPDDSAPTSLEQAIMPGSSTGKLPRPVTTNAILELGEVDKEPLPSPLTSLPHMPLPHQPPPAPKKLMMTTVLPVQQLTWVSKLSSYMQCLTKGEGRVERRGGMPGGMPSLRWVHPDWQERQECNTNLEQGFIAELGNIVVTATQDTLGDLTSLKEVLYGLMLTGLARRQQWTIRLTHYDRPVLGRPCHSQLARM